jgi:hypothetical protein
LMMTVWLRALPVVIEHGACTRVLAQYKTLNNLRLLQPPLFPSDCEYAQLLTIFQILGTPTDQNWPGVSDLRDWCVHGPSQRTLSGDTCPHTDRLPQELII